MKPFFSPAPTIFFNSSAAKDVPGNSVAMVKEAFSRGADVVSMNIQFSSDKIIMVIPEPLLDTISDGKGSVSDFTADELKKFDAGFSVMNENGEYPFRNKNYRFHSLDEILKEFPESRFNFTIMKKDPELVKAYVEIITENKAVHRVLTSSLYAKNIRLFRKLMPGSATAFSFAGMLGLYALFKSGLLFFIMNFNADAFLTPEAIGASYLANAGLIDQLHIRGIKTYVWNINDETQMKRVHGAGADGFMVTDIGMAKKFLENAVT